MFKKYYYVVMDTGRQLVSDIIETYNNFNHFDDLVMEMSRLEEKYGSKIVILNWKRLVKPCRLYRLCRLCRFKMF